MASEKIAPGLKGQRETVVCEHHLARHVERYSTPAMIGLMEGASVAACHHLLEPNQTTVGYIVNVRHRAPAPVGARVVAYAELTKVEGNKLTFKVEAYHGETRIGEGTHQRAVILSTGSG